MCLTVCLRQSRLYKDKVKRQRSRGVKLLNFKQSQPQSGCPSLSFAGFVQACKDKVGIPWGWEPVPSCRCGCHLHRGSLANGWACDKGKEKGEGRSRRKRGS